MRETGKERTRELESFMERDEKLVLTSLLGGSLGSSGSGLRGHVERVKRVKGEGVGKKVEEGCG